MADKNFETVQDGEIRRATLHGTGRDYELLGARDPDTLQYNFEFHPAGEPDNKLWEFTVSGHLDSADSMSCAILALAGLMASKYIAWCWRSDPGILDDIRAMTRTAALAVLG